MRSNRVTCQKLWRCMRSQTQGGQGHSCDPGLMGRVVDLQAFVAALGPILSRRVPEGAGIRVRLSTAGGSGILWVTRSEARLVPDESRPGLAQLNEEQLAEMLFHGCGPS